MRIKQIAPLLIVFIFISIALFALPTQASPSAPNVANNTIAPKWTCNLLSGGTACTPKTNDVFGHVPSPVIADIDGDGVDDIVVATSGGRITAVKNNGSAGQKIWNVDVAPAFGMPAGSQVIESSPAVADIDGDGFPEVVVGVGKSGSPCKKGGIIVLEHTGAVKAGWPRLAIDRTGDGCPEPIYTTPALGDLDNDGDMEIAAGGFDKRLYAWHHNGQLVDGFPIDSYLAGRFPDWGNLYNALADTIWSSPSLADVDNDGFLDILMGTDEGNFDARFGGDAGGWTCPYSNPLLAGYCGGSLYAVNRFGNVLPGFPIYILEHIQSTPALYDIDADGRVDIFIGTGTHYHNNTPERPTYGYRIFGWDLQGGILPGWGTQGAAVGERGGQVTNGMMPGSPAVGDIDGDGDPEIVAISMDKRLYAWHHTGGVVSGFPMTPVDQTGSGYFYNVGHGVVLADMDGDGAMEIFVTTGWSVTIINGAGNQLTTTSNPPNAPFYYAEGSLRNMPAFGDVDGDGELEMVLQNSNLYVWDLPGAGEADWPMYKQNAARTGSVFEPRLSVQPESLFAMIEANDADNVVLTIKVKNIGEGSFNWTVTSNDNLTISPSSGSVSESDTVQITVPNGELTMGTNNFEAAAAGKINGADIAGSPKEIPITVYVVEQIYSIYLPAIQK